MEKPEVVETKAETAKKAIEAFLPLVPYAPMLKLYSELPVRWGNVVRQDGGKYELEVALQFLHSQLRQGSLTFPVRVPNMTSAVENWDNLDSVYPKYHAPGLVTSYHDMPNNMTVLRTVTAADVHLWRVQRVKGSARPTTMVLAIPGQPIWVQPNVALAWGGVGIVPAPCEIVACYALAPNFVAVHAGPHHEALPTDEVCVDFCAVRNYISVDGRLVSPWDEHAIAFFPELLKLQLEILAAKFLTSAPSMSIIAHTLAANCPTIHQQYPDDMVFACFSYVQAQVKRLISVSATQSVALAQRQRVKIESNELENRVRAGEIAITDVILRPSLTVSYVRQFRRFFLRALLVVMVLLYIVNHYQFLKDVVLGVISLLMTTIHAFYWQRT
jgi:hypothetical protein